MEVIETPPKKKICMWCITRTLEEKLIGYRIIACECQHDIERDGRNYKISPYLLIRHLVIIGFLIVTMYSSFCKLMGLSSLLEVNSRFYGAIFAGSIVILFLLLNSLFTSHLHIKLVELSSEFITIYNDLGTIDFREPTIERLKRLYRLFALLLLIMAMLELVTSILLFVWKGWDHFWQVAILCFAVYILLGGILLGMGVIFLLKKLLIDGITQLEEALDRVIEHEPQWQNPEFKVLWMRIGEFTSLYSSVTKVQEITMKYLTVPIYCAIGTITIGMVMFSSLFGDLLINSELTSVQKTLIYSTNSVGIFSLTLLFCVLTYANSITDPGDHLLSFLFKYPISRLRQSERDQVELLINVFTIRKPIARVANVFNFRLPLIIPISSTILTYMLIVLQFYTSTLKKET